MDRSQKSTTGRISNLGKKTLKPQRAIQTLYAKMVQMKRVMKSDDAKIVSLFITPSINCASGAIKSIFSLHSQSRSILKEREGTSFLCCHPLSKRTLLKNNSFRNDEIIFRIEPLLERYSAIESLYLHVPDYMVSTFSSDEVVRLMTNKVKVEKFVFNIVVQNTQQLPTSEELKELGKIYKKITMTTTNHTYSNFSLRKKFDIPLHHFSTFIDPDSYKKVPWEKKEDLLLISPAECSGKEKFIEIIKKRSPHLEVVRLNKLRYDEYKKMIEKAKWVITTNRGLDSYFVEATFCGAVAFAIRGKEELIPDSVSQLPNLFSSEEELFDSFLYTFASLNSKKNEEVIDSCYRNLATLYSFEKFRKNIERYYEGLFDFP